ncbi:unnamed protein product [Calicophoron daubneyi]|uniref:Uncharacterized protein n=1 Tax=Calicophoron daubneyi TaxID=300641 RepID=A0AAV2TR80_CALDB
MTLPILLPPPSQPHMVKSAAKGKSPKVIAALASLIEAGVPGPFLIIAPLSLLPVWADQMAAFAPRLPCMIYYGVLSDRIKLRRRVKRLIRICLGDPIPTRDFLNSVRHYMRRNTVRDDASMTSISTTSGTRSDSVGNCGSLKDVPKSDASPVASVCSFPSSEDSSFFSRRMTRALSSARARKREYTNTSFKLEETETNHIETKATRTDEQGLPASPYLPLSSCVLPTPGSVKKLSEKLQVLGEDTRRCGSPKSNSSFSDSLHNSKHSDLSGQHVCDISSIKPQDFGPLLPLKHPPSIDLPLNHFHEVGIQTSSEKTTSPLDVLQPAEVGNRQVIKSLALRHLDELITQVLIEGTTECKVGSTPTSTPIKLSPGLTEHSKSTDRAQLTEDLSTEFKESAESTMPEVKVHQKCDDSFSTTMTKESETVPEAVVPSSQGLSEVGKMGRHSGHSESACLGHWDILRGDTQEITPLGVLNETPPSEFSQVSPLLTPVKMASNESVSPISPYSDVCESFNEEQEINVGLRRGVTVVNEPSLAVMAANNSLESLDNIPNLPRSSYTASDAHPLKIKRTHSSNSNQSGSSLIVASDLKKELVDDSGVAMKHLDDVTTQVLTDSSKHDDFPDGLVLTKLNEQPLPVGKPSNDRQHSFPINSLNRQFTNYPSSDCVKMGAQSFGGAQDSNNSHVLTSKVTRTFSKTDSSSHYQSSSLQIPLEISAPSPTFWSYPIVLTSYEVAIRDSLFLRRIPFKALVGDEDQRLKNPTGKLYKKLAKFSSGLRLLVTGTPLQNRISELWALLHFILPEIFTSLEMFEHWFDLVALAERLGRDRLIAAEMERSLVTELHCIIGPFMLRRTKADTDLLLPSKREILLRVGMTEFQNDLYDHVLDTCLPNRQNQLCMVNTAALKTKGSITYIDSANIIPGPDSPTGRCTRSSKRQAGSSQTRRPVTRSRSNLSGHFCEVSSTELDSISAIKFNFCLSPNISLNNVIMLLRRIANHPFLAVDRPDYSTDDGPPDNCVNTTDEKENSEDADKVLIFSQLTIVLDILEELLDARGWGFVRLDGTRKLAERQEAIKQFNYQPVQAVPVFLVSARAGGFGLNLQAKADTVILFDSDWNPQLDNLQYGNRQGDEAALAEGSLHLMESPRKRGWLTRRINKQLSPTPNSDSTSSLSKAELLNLLSKSDFHTQKSNVARLSNAKLRSLLDRSELCRM